MEGLTDCVDVYRISIYQQDDVVVWSSVECGAVCGGTLRDFGSFLVRAPPRALFGCTGMTTNNRFWIQSTSATTMGYGIRYYTIYEVSMKYEA